jgi:hypothetical protein
MRRRLPAAILVGLLALGGSGFALAACGSENKTEKSERTAEELREDNQE